MRLFTGTVIRWIFVLVALILTACQSVAGTATSTPLCIPSETKIDKTSGYPEIRASTSKGTLWALLVTQDGILHAGTNARILWKMTDGRGNINLTAIHEDGTQVVPVLGAVSRQARPEVSGMFFAVLRQLRTDWKKLPSSLPHGNGTQWKHPGQEWGSEFVFPQTGCWRILISRWLVETDEPVTGEIDIQVEP